MLKSIPYLSEEILDKLAIPCVEFVNSFERLTVDSENDAAWSAPKVVILPADGRYIMATLAASNNPPLVATKSLVLNQRNLDKGLPQINSLVTLLQAETGVPVAIIDGNWVTAVRTAGLSAVAAKYLANPDSQSIGFVGTGVQARSHLTAFVQQYPLRRIKLFGKGQQNIDALCQHASGLGLKHEVCSTPRQAATDVDIVVSSVTHMAIEKPLLNASWLASGCFVSSVESGMAWQKDSFSEFNQLIIDDLQQEADSPGKLARQEDVSGDLTGLITGRVAGRCDRDHRIAFVFRGHALGDLVLSALAYEKYCQMDNV